MANSNYNYKKYYPFLKWILAIASIAFFVWQWTQLDAQQWTDIWEAVKQQKVLIALVLILMLLNWFIESLKFRILLKHSFAISKLRSFFTVLGGTTLSTFTPARTGDYIGRSLLLKEVHPIKVVIATVTANLLQLTMTYSLGVICYLILLLSNNINVDLAEYSQKVGLVIVLLAVIVGLLYYFPKIFRRYRHKLPKSLVQALKLVSHYKPQLIKKITILSLLRYSTFTLQFYLLLNIFASEPLPFTAICFIPLAYLLQSLIPVPAISDVGVRIFFCQILFAGLLLDNEIVFAVSALWFINLMLPAFIGSLYLLYSLIPKD